MSARLLALDNNSRRAEFFGNLCQLRRGDNRHNRCAGLLAKLEHIAGKSRTCDHEINALVNRNFNGIGEVTRRDHLVDANDPIGRKRACEPNLITQSLRLHAGGRDESDSALIGSSGRKPRRCNADRHTALNDGDGGNFVANPHLG